ncbi:hypothetical protein B0H11DRAFT_2190345 [Mycena galericulata]|nr:hypothetical protein B0H11DRAFT_2190345 [Mycena galericulata]
MAGTVRSSRAGADQPQTLPSRPRVQRVQLIQRAIDLNTDSTPSSRKRPCPDRKPVSPAKRSFISQRKLIKIFVNAPMPHLNRNVEAEFLFTSEETRICEKTLKISQKDGNNLNKREAPDIILLRLQPTYKVCTRLIHAEHQLLTYYRIPETTTPAPTTRRRVTRVGASTSKASSEDVDMNKETLPVRAIGDTYEPTIRAVRRPVDGHGRRFDGTWTGTVRHATAVISTIKTIEPVDPLTAVFDGHGRQKCSRRARRNGSATRRTEPVEPARRARTKLVQRDYKDTDGSLIAPHELYGKLTNGTLILVMVSLVTYVIKEDGGKNKKIYHALVEKLKILDHGEAKPWSPPIPAMPERRPFYTPSPKKRVVANAAFDNFGSSPSKKQRK